MTMNAKKTYPLYFSFGALGLYFALFFFPCLLGLFYSFTDWNSFRSELNFVGLENFRNMFTENTPYLLYFKNTVKFTILTTVWKTAIGFALALLFTRRSRFANLHRMIIFSPQVLSFLITGLVFRSLLHPSKGFVNLTLESLGLGMLRNDWLMNLAWAFNSVIAVDTWKGVGYVMVVFIAGLNAIPASYHEAAIVDGAGFFQRVLRISIPMLIPSIMVVTVLNVTYGFRVFDIIYVLTNGGPGYATGVLNTAVFKEFSKGNYAMGTALSTVLFFLITGISYFIIRGMRTKEVEA
jgi:raffinose/stachyose/melibiose transport system permease protein